MLFYQIILYKIDFGAAIIQCLELTYLAYREYYFQPNSNTESLFFYILSQLQPGEVRDQGFSFFGLLVRLLPYLFFQLGLPPKKFSLNFLKYFCKGARWVLGWPQESFPLLKVPNFNHSRFLFKNGFFRAQVCPILLPECLYFQLPPSFLLEEVQFLTISLAFRTARLKSIYIVIHNRAPTRFILLQIAGLILA